MTFKLTSNSLTIHVDNTGCIKIAKNPILNRKTKHIEIYYHFIRERVERKEINLEYVPSNENLADMFTKPLIPGMFKALAMVLFNSNLDE